MPEWSIRAGNYRLIERMFQQRADADSIPPEEIQAYKDAIATPGALTAALNYYRTAFRSRLPTPFRRSTASDSEPTSGESEGQEWPVITAPTLLIWGTNDVALGVETTHGTQEWVPNLGIEFLHGASHWVQQERPEEVNRLMLDFLETLPD